MTVMMTAYEGSIRFFLILMGRNRDFLDLYGPVTHPMLNLMPQHGPMIKYELKWNPNSDDLPDQRSYEYAFPGSGNCAHRVFRFSLVLVLVEHKVQKMCKCRTGSALHSSIGLFTSYEVVNTP